MVELKIKMIRSKPDFCLMVKKDATKQPNYQVVLEHDSVFVRKVKVSPGVLLGHAKVMEKIQRNILLIVYCARLIQSPPEVNISWKKMCF